MLRCTVPPSHVFVSSLSDSLSHAHTVAIANMTLTPPFPFSILMDARVTGFPFNVLEHPMYDGASISFLGHAILYVPFPCCYFV